MKITQIKRHYNDGNKKLSGMIDETLKSGSYNESLYYQYTIMVDIEVESKSDHLLLLYYKAFWESIGDGKELYSRDDNFKKFSFMMSLMTAIDFIYEATPPLLQSEIKSSITSIDNIIEVLNTYLLENNSDKKLRASIFFKKNGLFEYGSIWNDSNGKTDFIRSIVDKNAYQPTIAYVDIEKDDFRQYIISGPMSQIARIHMIVKNLYITHVFVKKAESLTKNDIIYIKGYCTSFRARNFEFKTLDTLCFNTLKMLE